MLSNWDDAPVKDTATSTCTKCGGRLQHWHKWLARTASWLARMARGRSSVTSARSILDGSRVLAESLAVMQSIRLARLNTRKLRHDGAPLQRDAAAAASVHAHEWYNGAGGAAVLYMVVRDDWLAPSAPGTA